MENIKEKILEIITHTHKTPVEQADEILLLFSVVGRSEQLPCDYCGEVKELKYCQDCWEKLEQFKQCY
jgi:hypothetical protein